MARINVKANIIAPDTIDVPLVRADHIGTSNIFRVCFEVGLSLTSSLVGVVLSINNATTFHYVTLSVAGIATAAFLTLSIFTFRKATSM